MVTKIDLPADIEAWAAEAVAAGRAKSIEHFIVRQLREHAHASARPRTNGGDLDDQIADWIDHDAKGG